MESVVCSSKSTIGVASQAIASSRVSGNISRESTSRQVVTHSVCCARAGLRLSHVSVTLKAGGCIERIANDFRRKIALTGHRTKSTQRMGVVQMAVGETPGYDDNDYIAIGLAHCFTKDETSKLEDTFLIEPIPAGGLECMENGGVTCYKYVTATRLGKILSQDKSVLPAEFHMGRFCENFDFRIKCAARTWKRQHPQEHLMQLVEEGSVRSDFNFSVETKRILNVENIISDDDNIKQDLSIDVYGRAKENNDAVKEIEKLYNA